MNACEAVAAGEPLRVQNPRNNPTLCGELVLVAQKPVPWEWRNLQAEARCQEAIFLDVAC